jgi:putative ABC transport system substrate-binding protein
MTRRLKVWLFAACIIWVCPVAISFARDLNRLPHVEVIAPGFAADSPEGKAFREGMKSAGHTEGKNIVLNWWYGQGEYSGVDDAVERAVRSTPDVIVVESTVAALSAQRATQTIPIVMALVGDPEGVGLVESLRQPGGNITGLTNMSAQLAGKRLQLLKQAIPPVKRIGVLWNPATPMHIIGLTYLKSYAPQLHVDLIPMAVRKPEQFESAFAAFTRSKADAVLALDDPFMGLHGAEVLRLATKARLPLAYGSKPLAREGALIAYGTQFPDLFRKAAGYVDKILKGAAPASLPVEQPTKFDFVINLRAAKVLGLSIPESLVVQADEVIR